MTNDRLYEPRAYGPEPIRDCYWADGQPLEIDPSAEGNLFCDVAIVGGGYAGLNAALTLAKAGLDVAVFEANYVGFGASGRNGGFCCLGGDKLSQSELLDRYGRQETATYRAAQCAAIDHVASLLATYDIDADRHSHGETMLAHRAGDLSSLRQVADESAEIYGEPAELVEAKDLRAHGLSGPEFFGAVTVPFGFALNPMKYVQGLRRAVLAAGARIFGHSDVTDIRQASDTWQLATSTANISAQHLIVTTNGYSRENNPDWMRGRYLPTQSSILVTRPLQSAELQNQGFWSRQMCYDSRNLLHYFRLLPDNRFLFGMRAAIRATSAAFEQTRRAQIQDFHRMFPAWAGVDIPYFWSGLLCVSRARVPFAGAMAGLRNAWGAFAFHGNGVAMASYAGHAVASEILQQEVASPLPQFMSAAPRKFELGRYRRALLPLAYLRYKWADR